MPGTLHDDRWVDFGHNRTELLRLAHGRSDYLLLLDADMELVRRGALPATLTADSYLRAPTADDTEYWRKRLVSAAIAAGPTSAPPTNTSRWTRVPTQARSASALDALVIEHHHDGGARAEKLERDAALLERELESDDSNARAVFYLAQTYRDLQKPDQAIDLYERRAAMGGWDEEVFYALYQSGVLRAERGDWPAALAALVRAFEYRPARVEPLYELAARLRLRQEYETAYLFARRGLGRPMPSDILLRAFLDLPMGDAVRVLDLRLLDRGDGQGAGGVRPAAADPGAARRLP